ncbi:DUF2249 domain-containing protein [Melioribacteraceae bacterium 4301-Me]|uniref:DUF2249 domain-containing protein n=1 Tax=Pyranulibacter aquaticus TaxID=3163344 RepID=UPI003599F7FB
MITKEMKISEVLSAYPQTLNIFVSVSPHFKKLNNKILRKALASRVTVEQAASIANVDLNTLLFELNKSIQNSFESIKSSAKDLQSNATIIQKPKFFDEINPDKILKLDVRPIIDSGKDPFMDIMTKINELKDDEILLILNSFEPIPLYSVLGKKGFEHWTEKERNLFKVYFYRGQGKNQNEIPKEQRPSLQETDFKKMIELDVRDLVPPEPMMKILETLSKIDENTVLLVHHHREPMMLYPKLEERGYEAISNKIEENYYKVIITKKRN